MPDVTEPLTAYFDATVERVTAEDVVAGSAVRVQDGWIDPTRSHRLRPAWITTAGFVATIVFIGGAVGIAWLLRDDSTEVGVAPSPVGDAGAGPSTQWGLLIGIGLVLLLAVISLAVRGRNKIMKEQDMQTLERPEVEVSPRPRSPVILIAGLLVVAAGALGWWIGSSGDSVSTDIPEIVDSFNQALLDGDVDAMAALYAENGIWEEMQLQLPALSRDERYGGSNIAVRLSMGANAADTEEMIVDNVMVLDNLIVYEWTASGTSRSLPFETTGVMVFEMDGELIARSFLYYDSAEWFNTNVSLEPG